MITQTYETIIAAWYGARMGRKLQIVTRDIRYSLTDALDITGCDRGHDDTALQML